MGFNEVAPQERLSNEQEESNQQPTLTFEQATSALEAFAYIYIAHYRHKEEEEPLSLEVVKKRKPEIYAAIEYYFAHDPNSTKNWKTLLAQYPSDFGERLHDPFNPEDFVLLTHETGTRLAEGFLKLYEKEIEENKGFSPDLIGPNRPDVYDWFSHYFELHSRHLSRQDQWREFFPDFNEKAWQEKRWLRQELGKFGATYGNDEDDWPLSPIALAVEPRNRELYAKARTFLRTYPNLTWEDLIPKEQLHLWKPNASWGDNKEYTNLVISEEAEERLLRKRKGEVVSDRLVDAVAKNWPEAYRHIIDTSLAKIRRGRAQNLFDYCFRAQSFIKDGRIEVVADSDLRLTAEDGYSLTLDEALRECEDLYKDYLHRTTALPTSTQEKIGSFKEYASQALPQRYTGAHKVITPLQNDPRNPKDLRDFFPPRAVFDWDKEPTSENTFSEISKKVIEQLDEWVNLHRREYATTNTPAEINRMLMKKGGGLGPAFFDIHLNELYKEVERVVQESKGTGHDFSWKDLVESSNHKTFWENDSKCYDSDNIDITFDNAFHEWRTEPEKNRLFFFTEFIRQKHPELYQHVLKKAETAKKKGEHLTWLDFTGSGFESRINCNESFEILSETEIVERDNRLEIFLKSEIVSDIRVGILKAYEYYLEHQSEIVPGAQIKPTFGEVYLESEHFPDNYTIPTQAMALMKQAETEGVTLAWQHLVPEEIWAKWDSQQEWWGESRHIVTKCLRLYLREPILKSYANPISLIRHQHPFCYKFLLKQESILKKEGKNIDLRYFLDEDTGLAEMVESGIDFSIVPSQPLSSSESKASFLQKYQLEIKNAQQNLLTAYTEYLREPPVTNNHTQIPFGPLYLDCYLALGKKMNLPTELHYLLEQAVEAGVDFDLREIIPPQIGNAWNEDGSEWVVEAPIEVSALAADYADNASGERSNYKTLAACIKARRPFCYDYLVQVSREQAKRGQPIDLSYWKYDAGKPASQEATEAFTKLKKLGVDLSVTPEGTEAQGGFFERHAAEIVKVKAHLLALYTDYSTFVSRGVKTEFGPVTLEVTDPKLSQAIQRLFHSARTEGVPLTWSRLLPDAVKNAWDEHEKWDKLNIDNAIGFLVEDYPGEKQQLHLTLADYVKAEYPLCFGHILQEYKKALRKGNELDFRDFTKPANYTAAEAKGIDFSIIPIELNSEADSFEHIHQHIGRIYTAWLAEDPAGRKPFNSYTILHADSELYIRITRQIKETRDSEDPLNWLDFLPPQCWEAWPVSKKEHKMFQQRKEKQLESFLGQVANKENQGEKVEEFRKLLDVFGGNHCSDLLTRYLPEYKGVPQKRVKSLLGNYLGPYLLSKRPFSLENLRKASLYVDDLSLKDQFVEVVKEQCLATFKDIPKTSDSTEEAVHMQNAVENLLTGLNGIDSQVMKDINTEIREYFRSMYTDVTLPEYMVGEVRPGRPFPDFSQRINIKEIRDKKRMLIADDPGMGKSASAILAKENVGAKTALVVIPSNVISTWQRYLSEETAGGYFKSGQAPKVLTVESLEDLIDVQPDQYDYVLYSHERLTTIHSEALTTLPYDFLIVDEVHKLKNLKDGVRSGIAVELASKLEERNGHLALLSGTPVPNKIEDLAILLKLLYPERYSNTSNSQLVSSIINSDVLDLRSLLLSRMQMKKLEDVEDMPALNINYISVTPSELEKELYEAVMSDEEVTISQKLMMLRRIVLNPPLESPGAKTEMVASDLKEFFSNADRAVLFVNGYVDQIIRGGRSIIQHFNLPPDVELYIIDGTAKDRAEAEQALKRKTGKVLLVVSGQTADVGVDYSAAQKLFLYNEPWTKYDIRQQIARCYRPGLEEALDVNIYISEGTIEEGIHTYIETKEQAVEKLLKNIPVSDTERELLTKSEQQNSENLEVNAELSEYYYTSWDKMRRIFSYVKEIGVANFAKFLETYGEEYATCYESLGDRSYQANANRVLGTLLAMQVDQRGQNVQDIRIGDIGSGPEMLRAHMPEGLQDQVVSMDMNRLHFKDSTSGSALVGSFKQIPLQSKSLDYLNYNFVLHYSELTGSDDSFERLEVLAEANRVLKEGGRLIINTVHTLAFKNPARLKLIIEALGFKWIEEYSGKTQSDRTYCSDLITLEKTVDVQQKIGALVTFLENCENTDGRPNGRALWEGLKFRQVSSTLQNPREILSSFTLGTRIIDVHLNEHDTQLLEEEKDIAITARKLIENYQTIDSIPETELQAHEYTRYHNGKQSVLFKKLRTSEGGVTVKS